MAVSTGVGGLIVGLIRGWAIALCLLALGPPIGIAAIFYAKTL